MHVGGGYFDYVLPKSLFNNNSFLQTNQKTCQFFAHLFVSSFFWQFDGHFKCFVLRKRPKVIYYLNLQPL
jgi:hypothetical protein